MIRLFRIWILEILILTTACIDGILNFEMCSFGKTVQSRVRRKKQIISKICVSNDSDAKKICTVRGQYWNLKKLLHYTLLKDDRQQQWPPFERLPSIMHDFTERRCQSTDSFAQYTDNSSHRSMGLCVFVLALAWVYSAEA